MGFNDIIGQEIPKRLLQSQIKYDRIGTSYLFYGPEGVGKTMVAKTFAKSINCANNGIDACDVCPTCKGIEENPDFVFIEPTNTGNIGIYQIRAIKSNTSYRTVWLKFRIIIIKEADTLTEEAANAFLKILEESPPRTIFILTTSKIDAILPTVRSRCQQIRFRRLSSAEIKKLVPDASDFILHIANGSVTRTIKLTKPETQEIRDRTLQFFEAEVHQRIQLVEKLVPKSKEDLHDGMEEFLCLTQELYRNLLSKSLGIDNKDRDLEFKHQLPVLKILSAITTLEKAFYALSHNVHKKLILYWLCKELP